jgi:hypothetical protein
MQCDEIEKQIIEAAPEELAKFCHVFAGNTEIPIHIRFYAEALLAYHNSDQAKIKSIAKKFFKQRHREPLSFLLFALTGIRWKMRSGNLEVGQVLSLLRAVKKSQLPEHWLGEWYFVVGLAFSQKNQFPNAYHYYARSYQKFHKLGMKKKALKALLNKVVADSRAFPKKKMFWDYTFVAKEALANGDSALAGVCQLNLSREFQILGALEMALQVCSQSLENLEKDTGTLHYFLAKAHRAHLYIALGNAAKAK